jgi:hypothetical protein
MTDLRCSESVVVASTPEAVYAMVADVTRMGEFSPTCAQCWWDEGAGPEPGSWFTGRNVTPERTWETRSQVVTAEPGRAFGWVVGEGWVRWDYTFEPAPGGVRVTESWEFTAAGLARFRERFGDDADAQIADRTAQARAGIPVTLAAIQRVAEQEPVITPRWTATSGPATATGGS